MGPFLSCFCEMLLGLNSLLSLRDWYRLYGSSTSTSNGKDIKDKKDETIEAMFRGLKVLIGRVAPFVDANTINTVEECKAKICEKLNHARFKKQKVDIMTMCTRRYYQPMPHLSNRKLKSE